MDTYTDTYTDINTERNCFICLDHVKDTEKTICCNNYIDKACLLTWIIYSGEIECCICKSNKIKVSKHDIIKYDINNIKQYNLDETFFVNNMNKLLKKISNNSIIIYVNDSIQESEQSNWITRVKHFLKSISINLKPYLLITCIVIILLFILSKF